MYKTHKNKTFNNKRSPYPRVFKRYNTHNTTACPGLVLLGFEPETYETIVPFATEAKILFYMSAIGRQRPSSISSSFPNDLFKTKTKCKNIFKFDAPEPRVYRARLSSLSLSLSGSQSTSDPPPPPPTPQPLQRTPTQNLY